MDIHESRDNLEYMKAMLSFYPSVEKGWITTEDGQHLFLGGDGTVSGGKAAYEAHQNESKGSSGGDKIDTPKSNKNGNSTWSKYSDKELQEIYNNLKTSAKILGFASKGDSEMIAGIEIEAANRGITLKEPGAKDSKANIQTEATTDWDPNDDKSIYNKYEADCKAVGITNASEEYSELKFELLSKGIGYLPVQNLEAPLSSREIIQKIGGPDKTGGSCASLAYAYAANRIGLDVTDYRGGDSQGFFSDKNTGAAIAELPGVNGVVIKGTNTVKMAKDLLDTMEPGKEYILGVGKHAAIVRQNGGIAEYLELQDHKLWNGFKTLTTDKLQTRFGCTKSSSYTRRGRIIEIDNLKDNKEFRDLLGHINTSPGSQQKGAGGGMK